MKVQLLNKGFNFSQDGPGNRLVYHLQGCNFCCPWCSNPESINPHGILLCKGKINDTDCPYSAISGNSVDRNICYKCETYDCTKQNRSISWSCKTVDTETIVDEAIRSRMMFFDGGGVTFSGGEPCFQFEALSLMLQELKKHGINTALETNGSFKNLPDLFQYIDYLIIDLKHHDFLKHKSVIGSDNSITVENISKALLKRNQLLIRIPLIHGFNSSIEDALAFADLFKDKNLEICKFEILKYHEYGKDKWAQSGYTYTDTDMNINDGEYKLFCETLENKGLELINT